MKGSLTIIALFALGVACGHFGWMPREIAQSSLSFYTLCLLMLCVGIGIGNNPHALQSIRSLSPRLAVLPVMTVAGTLAGSAIASLWLPHLCMTESLAVGSGFGYYSLSSIFITQYKGGELGITALISNILREIITLLCAPFLAKYFGKLAPISVGGATTLDTTLPIITQSSGQEFAMLSVYHGFVVDFSVPFLVTFFCSLPF